MSAGPYVGGPSDDLRSVCTYSVEPCAPRCEHAATLHVQVICLEWGPVALATCDEHAAAARATGVLVDEHPYGQWCWYPDAMWLPGGCTVGTR